MNFPSTQSSLKWIVHMTMVILHIAMLVMTMVNLVQVHGHLRDLAAGWMMRHGQDSALSGLSEGDTDYELGEDVDVPGAE